VPAGAIYPHCKCDENNWWYAGMAGVNQQDCNGYTCFGY
jgi:hypothetical protein